MPPNAGGRQGAVALFGGCSAAVGCAGQVRSHHGALLASGQIHTSSRSVRIGGLSWFYSIEAQLPKLASVGEATLRSKAGPKRPCVSGTAKPVLHVTRHKKLLIVAAK